MAYAALLSLAQVLHQTLNRDYQYLILDEKQQIESLVEIITSIQKDFSSQKKIRVDENGEIMVAAYIVEDIIESRIIERFRTESAGNEDGSTEKKLVRFNVLEDWIVASSKSAPGRRGLEIVGVGGVVKRLATHGTKIVIIINPSMRASVIMEKLSIFGFDTSLFVGVISDKDLRAHDAQFEELGSSSPAPSLQPWATYNPEAVSSKMYKSAMVMAGVDAVDRCIAVGGNILDLKAANAAGISSIIMAKVGDFAAEYDAHPTYVLRSFTW